MIHKTVMAEIGITMPELWKVYRQFQDIQMTGKSVSESISILQLCSDPKALQFFLAYGLVSLEKEMDFQKDGL